MTGGNYRSNYYGLQYAHVPSPGYHRPLTVRSHAHNPAHERKRVHRSLVLRCGDGRMGCPGGTLPWRDSVLNQIEGFLEVVVCFGKQMSGRLNLVHCRGRPGRRS